MSAMKKATQMEHQRVAQKVLQKAGRLVAGTGDRMDFLKDNLLGF